MADARQFELDELVNRPGTYFNPQTEVLVVVDDSQAMDAEIFNMEEFEGADWVLISDELPVDEPRRDELLETFQVHYHPGAITADNDDDIADEPDEQDDQEVGRE
jgi:cupin superfamily acireductone dioxygenase involved in methionine salvage